MGYLSETDRKRYQRQISIPGWGEEGQVRVQSARVFIAGAGGLGSPVALYLAAAGVGEIAICDSDRVTSSNLNRQILHSDERIGELKAESAASTLRQLNPGIRIIPIPEHLEKTNAERIIGKPDILMDCLDNYETRYVLNDYSIENGIPLVHGAIWGLVGQVTFLAPPTTPCLRCIVPTPPTGGIFPAVGVTTGVIGTLQAMEALKFLTGIGTNLKGTMLFFDGEEMTFTPLQVRRSATCPACGHLPV
jgi:adenylyltransferase/sulfurtransferase